MPTTPFDEPHPIRITVTTAGAWRAEQVARALLAIDGIVARVGYGSHIAAACEEYDYVVRHMGMFGLLEKPPESWEKPKSPTDLELRTKLAEFVSLMRRHGVDVKITPLGVSFGFLVDDLYDLTPASAKVEVERISMASPGEWSLLASDALKAKGAFRLLEKIFDALFFRAAAKRERMAEARQAEARATLLKAKAEGEKEKAKREAIQNKREEALALSDYAVAIDSLILALNNAGFDIAQTQKVIQAKLTTDIDFLARCKSLGLIETVDITRLNVDGGD